MEYKINWLNPWWDLPHWQIDKRLAYHRKEFNAIIECLEKVERIPLLVGPRRVGKTTLLLQLADHFLKKMPRDNILYYSFERADPAIPHNADALEQLIATWGGHSFDLKKPRLLLLDEVQNVRGWGGRIKSLFDLHQAGASPIKVIITGSSSFDLLGQALLILHGVVRHIAIPPFSFTDLWRMKHPNDVDLIDQIMDWQRTWWASKKHHHFGETVHVNTPEDDYWTKARRLQKEWLYKGGFPEFWNEDPLNVEGEMLDYFVRRVAYEDLLLERGLSNPLEVSRFLKYCYFNPGVELNVTGASQQLGIARSTLDVALDLLNKAGYIRVLPRFGGGKLRQRHVKIYPIDHALIPLALRMRENEPTDQTLETMVVNTFAELPGSELYYFRKKQADTTHEIDLVVTNATKRIAIEIKKRLKQNSAHVAKEKFRDTLQYLPKPPTHRMLIGWDSDEKGWPRGDYLNEYRDQAIEIVPLWRLALGLL
jgi:predicted AAA+ superfamily ATPase